MKPAVPTINDVLQRFLTLPATTIETVDVVELLRSYLDGYGHQMLSGEEAAFFARRYEEDEEAGAFCNLFGPEYILEGLPEFLGWFVIRKVMALPEQVASYGPVTDRLVTWLAGEGIVPTAATDGAKEAAAAAARDLPAAEQLSTLLYDSAEGIEPEAVLEYVDWESEVAEISRIEPGRLWFRSELGQIGPVVVPKQASELARVRWSVSALGFARTERGWLILEMGNVYPS